ncbi:hypothetical protein BGX26_004297 [Mortierella sp. AD094]|nr:hypothetical protein BGX26_004297 [Mortierella sp. AD094]
MLTRATFVALTTALALLVTGPILASSFPLGGDEPPVIAETPSPPITSRASMIPHAHATTTHPLSEDILEFGGDVEEFSDDIQILDDYLSNLNHHFHRFRYPTGYKPPHYTYGNSLDSWGDDEESNDTVDIDGNCARLSPTPYHGTTGERGGDAQHPFVEIRQKSSCASKKKDPRYIGIDLREHGFSVGFVNAEGKSELIPNEEGQLYTPTEVRFIDGGRRAIVGRSAWSTNDNNTQGTRGTQNQVDLSKLRDADTYKVYPKDVRFGLSSTLPTMADAEVEEDILAVLMLRAVDMAEAYLDEKIEGVMVTCPKKILKYGARGESFLRDTIFDTSREQAIMQAGSRIQQLGRYSDYSEILALIMGHVPFFDSRLQLNPDIVEEDPVYLSQTVLMYNLRDSSEDLVVMRYTKGFRKAYHLDFLAGYLPNDGNIRAQFSQYMTKYVLDRFNSGIGAKGKDRSHKDSIDAEFRSENDMMVESMDRYLTKSFARDDRELRFRITKDSYVAMALKDYRECKMQFLKERLSASVERVLVDAGIEDWSKIDHLIVADDYQFQAQSTVVLEDIVFGGHKKAVTEYDQHNAIAMGIARMGS